jgi:hypothetical protein
MAFRKSSLRRVSPLARDLLKVANELQSVRKKVIRIAGKVQDLELGSRDYGNIVEAIRKNQKV